MNFIINTLLVLGVIIFAIYIAPFLIALIATGIIQLVIAVFVIYCLVKMALNNDYIDR